MMTGTEMEIRVTPAKKAAAPITAKTPGSIHFHCAAADMIENESAT